MRWDALLPITTRWKRTCNQSAIRFFAIFVFIAAARAQGSAAGLHSRALTMQMAGSYQEAAGLENPAVRFLKPDAFQRLLWQMCKKGTRPPSACTKQVKRRTFGTTLEQPSGKRVAYVVHGLLDPLLEAVVVVHESAHLEQQGGMNVENEKLAERKSIEFLQLRLGDRFAIFLRPDVNPTRLADALGISRTDHNLSVLYDLIRVVKEDRKSVPVVGPR